MATATTIENERMIQLQEERMMQEEQMEKQTKTKKKSFSEKAKQHQLLIITAVFFDVLALIPGLSVVFNTIFAGIVFVYFLGKKDLGEGIQSSLSTIFLPFSLGTIIDSIFSFLPVNLAVVLIKIYKS